VSAHGDRALPLRRKRGRLALSASTATVSPASDASHLPGANRRAQSRRRRREVARRGRRERGAFPGVRGAAAGSTKARVHRATRRPRRRSCDHPPTAPRELEAQRGRGIAEQAQPRLAALARSRGNRMVGTEVAPSRRAPCAASSSTRRRCTALYAASSLQAGAMPDWLETGDHPPARLGQLANRLAARGSKRTLPGSCRNPGSSTMVPSRSRTRHDGRARRGRQASAPSAPRARALHLVGEDGAGSRPRDRRRYGDDGRDASRKRSARALGARCWG